MKTADFTFSLPEHLIAHFPCPERTGSRLLCLDKSTGQVQHHQFLDILNYVNAGDLLVFNNTKVIPARLFGRKSTGGKVEVLVERLTDEYSCIAHVRANKSLKEGAVVEFANNDGEVVGTCQMIGRQGGLFSLQFNRPLMSVLNTIGHIPLPPYINREDTLEDQSRYQTVYSKTLGAVAAPTAGLHFDEVILQKLADKGVELGFVTLHVGAGTFKPVQVDDVNDHTMHREWLEVDATVCQQVANTKARGGKIIAVGTTTVRSLESAAQINGGVLKPYKGETDIFIYPGFEFKVIDGLLTNFHLPESTLLMLISALAGRDAVLAAYNEAIKQEYRFFSYGDAMLIKQFTNNSNG